MKLLLTLTSFLLLMLAGRRVMPGALPPDVASFAVAMLLGTMSILSLGFVLASIVPTARFAQPIGAAVFYPMLALSGLFFPIARLPVALRVVAELLPTTQAVTLMRGAWDGVGWGAQVPTVLALLGIFAVCLTLATRWFRWE